MGILEFSLVMFASVTLESATNNTSRLGKTGYVAAGAIPRDQQIIANVKTKTTGFLDPAKLSISAKVYADLSKIGQPEPCITPSPCGGTAGVNYTDVNGNGTWDADMGKAGYGAAGEVVVYTVSYQWDIFTPMVSSIIGTPFTINARSVVRNEPFAVAGGR
jgi:hypothetical protein